MYGAEKFADRILHTTGRAVPRPVVWIWRWLIPPLLSLLILSGAATKLQSDWSRFDDGRMTAAEFFVAWFLATSSPAVIFAFIIRACLHTQSCSSTCSGLVGSRDPNLTVGTSEASDDSNPDTVNQAAFSWLSCFLCMPVGIFSVQHGERAKALTEDQRAAGSVPESSWSFVLACVALSSALVFYPMYIRLGSGCLIIWMVAFGLMTICNHMGVRRRGAGDAVQPPSLSAGSSLGANGGDPVSTMAIQGQRSGNALVEEAMDTHCRSMTEGLRSDGQVVASTQHRSA